jgi:hypothetical protein
MVSAKLSFVGGEGAGGGTRLLPRGRQRGPVVKRDEGSGETDGVSPGAVLPPVETQSGPGRIRSQNEGV